MRKVGAAVAIVLLTVLALRLWPHGHESSQHRIQARPLSRAAATSCGTKVVNDWVRDGRIDSEYRRECYSAALDRMFAGEVNCATLYGGGLCDDLVARLQNSG
jgi:ribose 1,5-bisphosphokinase PhnN